jgi:predicted amidohydrolase YtcJ
VSHLPRANHRHRIEHCSVCRPTMAKRLAQLGAVVVTQPPFIYYNGERYLKTVPSDQINDLYPLATLIKAGIKLAAGSDCPVVPPNPLNGIYAAVSRLDEIGQTIASEQRITPQQALSMYTDAAAYSCFQENLKGLLTRGKLADLVVVSNDPSQVATEEIKDLEIKMTLIGGEIVWSKGF